MYEGFGWEAVLSKGWLREGKLYPLEAIATNGIVTVGVARSRTDVRSKCGNGADEVEQIFCFRNFFYYFLEN